MEQERKAIRLGLVLITCATVWRLMGGIAGPVSALLSKPETAAFLLYLQTGRVVSPLETGEPTQAPTLPEQTGQTQPALSEGIFFDREDAQLVQVSNLCDYTVDLEQMLLTPLEWRLVGENPTVLIIHSHTTESYTQTPENTYQASAQYRTLDTQHNMVRVGEALKTMLEEQGISVLHDKTLHDHPSYNDAYIHAREQVQAYLAQYPSICLVLDLHRDALENGSGKQMGTEATVDGASAAQLMMVVGTNAGGREHPGWADNMALAVKLHAQLEKRWPGLCRPISFRTERFNQDLSPGAILIEVGAAGNTLEEALVAAGALAQGIGDLAQGTVTADSTS